MARVWHVPAVGAAADPQAPVDGENVLDIVERAAKDDVNRLGTEAGEFTHGE